MTRQSCDAEGVLAAFRAGLANLEAHVEQVNSMNVFPVPDGDTGSNMVATARAALVEAERAVRADAGLTAAAISRGALFGARGNSGVIASQIARGLAEALAGKQRIGGRDLARALARGAEAAYGAVADPVEGTMLTVIRDAADAARRAADQTDDPAAILREAVEAAESSVARTPELLSVLREAGVADAGGEGLYLLLAGALDAIDGVTPRRHRIETIARPRVPAHAGDGFGFETMFSLEAAPGGTLDIAAIRVHLGSIWHSVVVAGDAQAATVHVHGAVPDEVLAYARGLGALSRISVENLDLQARAAFEHGPAAASTPAATSGQGPAVIAVVSGDGFAALFESLRATVIGANGQGPAAGVGELCDAIDRAPPGDVVIVPSDASALAAAEEAAQLSDRRVWVVPARNAAEAAAAMLALDDTKEPGTIATSMAAAAGRIQSIVISAAPDGDGDAEEGPIRRRRAIARAADGHVVAVENDVVGASLAGLEALAPGFELLTIYHGAAIDREAAEDLGRAVAGRLPEVEVEIVPGGQPDSLYLIAAE